MPYSNDAFMALAELVSRTLAEAKAVDTLPDPFMDPLQAQAEPLALQMLSWPGFTRLAELEKLRFENPHLHYMVVRQIQLLQERMHVPIHVTAVAAAERAKAAEALVDSASPHVLTKTISNHESAPAEVASRRVEVLIRGEWVSRPFMALKYGDWFRMFEYRRVADMGPTGHQGPGSPLQHDYVVPGVRVVQEFEQVLTPDAAPSASNDLHKQAQVILDSRKPSVSTDKDITWLDDAKFCGKCGVPADHKIVMRDLREQNEALRNLRKMSDQRLCVSWRRTAVVLLLAGILGIMTAVLGRLTASQSLPDWLPHP